MDEEKPGPHGGARLCFGMLASLRDVCHEGFDRARLTGEAAERATGGRLSAPVRPATEDGPSAALSAHD